MQSPMVVSGGATPFITNRPRPNGGVVAAISDHVDVAARVRSDAEGAVQRVPIARRVDDLGDRAGSAAGAARARSRDLEDVVAVKSGHVDVAAGIHGDSIGGSENVPTAVARRVDDLGDGPAWGDPEDVLGARA